MPTKPTKRLMSELDTDRPSLISQNLLSGNVNDEDCPWVEIGNLYLSVTIIGENSWLPLISLLSKRGESLRRDHTKYVIFTGRHGDIPNLVNNRTQKTENVFDKNHVTEDEAVKKKALAEFPFVNIELVDAAQGAKLQSDWLKKETSRHIFARKVVIYAWCYGLFTMSEGDADAPPMVVESHNSVLINKTVSELVREYWNWVPIPIM